MKRPQVGDVLPERLIESVSADKMKILAAVMHDGNPIHLDGEAAAAQGLGDRPINQGPLNMVYVMDMLAAWSGDPYAVQRFDVRFTGNVCAGDRVRAGGSVTSVDDAHAECQVWLEVDGADRVLEGSARVRIEGGPQ